MMTKQAELKKQAYASSLKSRALSVLIYLIDRSNKDLTCYPAIPTIAVQLHISISTVKRALKELVDAGYIEKAARYREKNRGQSSNLYTLLFVDETFESSNYYSPTKADSEHIDAFAPQESSKSDIVEHITFDMLAKNNKIVIQKQSKHEIRNQEKRFYRFEDRSMVSALCTPVQGLLLTKRTKLQSISDVNVKKDLLTCCQTPFYRWTGEESILQPP